MTKKEYEVQKALGLADHFLLEFVVGPPHSRKEVEKAVAKHTYDSRLLRWENTPEKWDSRFYGAYTASSYIFDIKCPFGAAAKIRVELGIRGRFVSYQISTWSIDQYTTLNYHNL